jgi:hypothetical protein
MIDFPTIKGGPAGNEFGATVAPISVVAGETVSPIAFDLPKQFRQIQ